MGDSLLVLTLCDARLNHSESCYESVEFTKSRSEYLDIDFFIPVHNTILELIPKFDTVTTILGLSQLCFENSLLCC